MLRTADWCPCCAPEDRTHCVESARRAGPATSARSTRAVPGPLADGAVRAARVRRGRGFERVLRPRRCTMATYSLGGPEARAPSEFRTEAVDPLPVGPTSPTGEALGLVPLRRRPGCSTAGAGTTPGSTSYPTPSPRSPGTTTPRLSPGDRPAVGAWARGTSSGSNPAGATRRSPCPSHVQRGQHDERRGGGAGLRTQAGTDRFTDVGSRLGRRRAQDRRARESVVGVAASGLTALLRGCAALRAGAARSR